MWIQYMPNLHLHQTTFTFSSISEQYTLLNKYLLDLQTMLDCASECNQASLCLRCLLLLKK
jgi:hypothetical protein